MITKEEILDALVSLYKNNFPDSNIDFDKVDLETNLVLSQAILDENLLNYLTLMANESTLPTAILPETIYQFASTFGYIPKSAQPAHSIVDLYIPIEQSGTVVPQLKLTLDFNTEFKSGDITYRPTRKVFIDYVRDSNTISIVSYDVNGNKFIIPGFIDTLNVDGKPLKCIHFTLELEQSRLKLFTFSITQDDISNYKFPTFFIPSSEISPTNDEFISDFRVSVSNNPAIRVPYLYAMDKNVYSYTVVRTNTGYKFVFGNGYIGRELRIGDYITIEANLTLGEGGNIAADTLKLSSIVTNEVTKQPVNIYVKHSDITNGSNEEDLISIKNNIIKTISSNNRIVSEYDFKNISSLIDFGSEYVYVVYSKSDLQVNEIDLYSTYSNNDKFMKTTSISLYDINDIYFKQNTLIYEKIDGTYTFDEPNQEEIRNIWMLPFELFVDTNFYYVKTSYVLNNYYIGYRTLIENYYSLDNQSFVNLNKVSTMYINNTLLYDYIIKGYYDQELVNYDVINENDIVMKIDLFVNTTEISFTTDSNGLIDLSTFTNNFDIKLELTSKNDYRLYETKDIRYAKYDPTTSILSIYFVIEDTEDKRVYSDEYQGTVTVYYGYAGYNKEILMYTTLKPFFFKLDVTDKSPVKIVVYTDINNNVHLSMFNIPLVEFYSYYEDKEFSDNAIFSVINSLEEISDKVMLSIRPNFAFPKTYGLITNVKYNDEDIINNTISENEISLPLKLKIDVYVNTGSDISLLKDTVMYSLRNIILSKYTGFQKSIVINKLEHDLYTAVASTDIIKFDIYFKDAQGNYIKKDLVYNFDFNTMNKYNNTTLTSKDILEFVPEFIWVDFDNIELNFIQV